MIVDLLNTPKPISKYDTNHIKRGSFQEILEN